ncbi:hypothetical protein PVAP13_9NG505900 [Panicum virgatum]|uniref:Cystatin domain-containing protein n=1 Tax=Panicum virgatum TaxID=38727 RepID=A0A8T0MRT4_PANVG|nr:hypothetical protein PVAP13_9NG505900 [Panicum virgatum]
MSARALLLLAAILLAAAAAPAPAPAASTRAPRCGWSPVRDGGSDGSWAVADHARRANDGLRFGKVTSAQEQIVDGMNYKLFLDAADASGDVADYGALVYEQERTNTRELTSFARAPAK